MKQVLETRFVKVPKGVTVVVGSRKVTVTGPRGTLSRDFTHRSLDIQKVGKRSIKVDLWFGSRKELACVRTICSHIENMITGVTQVLQLLKPVLFLKYLKM